VLKQLVKCLILYGKPDSEVLRLARKAPFDEVSSLSDDQLYELILEVRRNLFLKAASDLFKQGFASNEILRELKPLRGTLPLQILNLALKEAADAAASKTCKAPLKELDELFSRLKGEGELFLATDHAGPLLTFKLYGDRLSPAYLDLSITIEKYDDEQRFLLLNFFKSLIGKTARDFTRLLVGELEAFGNRHAKLDILTLVMGYIEEDVVSLSLKGFLKDEIIGRLKAKYSDVLDYILRTQSTISPIDREFQRAASALKSPSTQLGEIAGIIARVGSNRFVIATPKYLYPNFIVDIAIVSWSKRIRDMLVKLFNSIASKGVDHLALSLISWLETFQSKRL